MNSRLYECRVSHCRMAPRRHSFQHDIFMLYLDLDEADSLGRSLRLFGCNRAGVYSFRDADHEPAGPGPLKQRIEAFLLANGIESQPGNRIMLLTLPRVLGYIFNPISVYYCFDAKGRSVCAVAEVGNTFREMKLYLLKRDGTGADGAFRQTVPKLFYVSPFSALDVRFDFDLGVPGERLELKIDDWDGEKRVFTSGMSGRARALTDARLGWFMVKYPLLTLKVIFLIHWHAFVLWLKGAPFYRKAAQPALQQDVLRPHSSLVVNAK